MIYPFTAIVGQSKMKTALCMSTRQMNMAQMHGMSSVRRYDMIFTIRGFTGQAPKAYFSDIGDGKVIWYNKIPKVV